ncbi:fluoride efflux transporter FluC [Cohnella panacarvi]|uniref:fluoride efflux transporter FluC n=1 Tax=Cohnella panacarvi TaxID=400776 RepID=UPI00047EBE0A|nr:CrcB family protein [Cohnella panacarvi]
MSLLTIGLVGLGGAIGTLIRYGVGWLATRKNKPSYLATLTVNLSGCFFIGLLLGLGWQDKHEALYAFAATGVLGGLTTYSTLNVQKATMRRTSSRKTLGLYLLATYAGGALLTAAGAMVSHFVIGYLITT